MARQPYALRCVPNAPQSAKSGRITLLFAIQSPLLPARPREQFALDPLDVFLMEAHRAPDVDGRQPLQALAPVIDA